MNSQDKNCAGQRDRRQDWNGRMEGSGMEDSRVKKGTDGDPDVFGDMENGQRTGFSTSVGEFGANYK